MATTDTLPATSDAAEAFGGEDVLSVLARCPDGGTFQLDAEPVLAWDQRALDTIQAESASPLLASRTLAMESIAVLAVVDAIDSAPLARLAGAEFLEAVSVAAVATAAHRVLSEAFPAQGAALDAALAESLAGVPDGAAETVAVAFGGAVAETVIALRAGDGWDVVATYEGGTEPGEWRPTPPGFLPALAPHWASVEPFALAGTDQFRPGGPPDLAGADYAAALDEVERLGSVDSSERTADQTETALFWADGAGTYTPPGHWNEIAVGIAARVGLGAAESARVLAVLNVALADAGSATWDTKYAYGSWRPVTAIRLADADRNPETAADPGWSPLLVTPNHPEYVSGHAAFSGAAATVLTAFFGDVAFSATSEAALPGIKRDFANFADAAAEAGRSRVFAGIHFEFSDQDGLAMGRAVGDWALDAFC